MPNDASNMEQRNISDSHFRNSITAKNRSLIAEQALKIEILKKKIDLDPLTGLYSREFWDQEVNRLSKSRNPLLIVYIDTDGLKKINDHHGHAEGDRYIQGAADILKTTFRPEDVIARVEMQESYSNNNIIARLGLVKSDEIGVMVPITPQEKNQNLFIPENIEVLKNKFRKRVGYNINQYNAKHEIPISLSIGIAFAHNGQELIAAIKTAEEEMYKEKKKKKQEKSPPNEI